MKAADSLPKYSPRWRYLFFALLERLPVPGWALAAFAIVAIAAAAHWVAWSKGLVPFGQLDRLLSTMGIFTVTGFAQWQFLTMRARPAIQSFFMGSKSPAQIEAILSDFVSLPSLWGTFAFIVGALGSISGFRTVMNKLAPISAQVLPELGLLTSILGGGFAFIVIYRIARQSLLTRRFYRETKVDLFNPAPLHALSAYAVTSIIALLLGTYLLQLIAIPNFFLTPLGIAYQVIISSVLLAFFFAQLLGANQRMRQAKGRLLTELGKDIESVYNEVHKAVSKKAYAAVSRMQASVVTLRNEQETIQKIPTWPWQPETLRNLLTPMLIPVIVYLIQRFVGGALGF